MTLRSWVIERSPTVLQDDLEITSHWKTAHIGPRSSTETLQLDDRPAIELIEGKVNRRNMLPVNKTKRPVHFIIHMDNVRVTLTPPWTPELLYMDSQENTTVHRMHGYTLVYIYIYIYITGHF